VIIASLTTIVQLATLFCLLCFSLAAISIMMVALRLFDYLGESSDESDDDDDDDDEPWKFQDGERVHR